jgi:hypothetical protein
MVTKDELVMAIIIVIVLALFYFMAYFAIQPPPIGYYEKPVLNPVWGV